MEEKQESLILQNKSSKLFTLKISITEKAINLVTLIENHKQK